MSSEMSKGMLGMLPGGQAVWACTPGSRPRWSWRLLYTLLIPPAHRVHPSSRWAPGVSPGGFGWRVQAPSWFSASAELDVATRLIQYLGDLLLLSVFHCLILDFKDRSSFFVYTNYNKPVSFSLLSQLDKIENANFSLYFLFFEQLQVPLFLNNY